MLSKIPVNLDKVKKKDLDKQILRLSISAELDAISLYKQLAAATENERIRKMLLDIAKEEKTHVGELQALLLEIDLEQAGEIDKGKEEVGKIV
ncbi:rubrerythrin [Archaeoglobales archaeon]|nr:MAG: rubrerythrin [Archaeoglobales archaeon]